MSAVSRDDHGWVWFFDRVAIGARVSGQAFGIIRPNGHMTIVRCWPFVVAWYTGPPF